MIIFEESPHSIPQRSVTHKHEDNFLYLDYNQSFTNVSGICMCCLLPLVICIS